MDGLLSICRDYPAQVSAFVAVCALFTSLLTSITLFVQRRHNLKSVKPIAHVSLTDNDKVIAVDLCNNGVGPLLVEGFTAECNGETEDDIISWLPNPPTSSDTPPKPDTFYDCLDGLPIPAGEKVTVIRFTEKQNQPTFSDYRDEVRKALAQLTIRVRYKDIYGREMTTVERALDWFGRHFAEDDDASKEATTPSGTGGQI